jgi:hypothetical protein
MRIVDNREMFECDEEPVLTADEQLIRTLERDYREALRGYELRLEVVECG